MKLKTVDIVTRINNDFGATYKNAAPFVGSGHLWDFCMKVISDPIKINCIIFANDLNIPPVKSLLCFYERENNVAGNFKFTQQESQWMGSLMGFVFKFVLGYSSQKERNKVNNLGVGTATRFYDVDDVVNITE